MMDPQARALLLTLWRGAPAGYYWERRGKLTQWTPATDPAPCVLGDRDVYFGIHPLAGMRGEHERGRIGDVGAVNCLFAEFDAKDERFAGDLANVRAHILALPLQPQVIVYSGGGCHCYWILAEPIKVDDSVRRHLAGLQRGWVTATGGDPGARDLARVLRLPGTLNTKYTPARQVKFARCNLCDLYDVNVLFAAAEEHFDDQAPDDRGDDRGDDRPPASRAAAALAAVQREERGVIDLYNAQTSVTDLLRHYGYFVSADGRHFVRPGKDPREGISGTIDPDHNRAYTFSSNDPGFDARVTSPSGAGCTLKPFDLLARLSFKGDARAAVRHLHQAVKAS